jgi:hypothetical protein
MAQPSSIPPGTPQNRWKSRNYDAALPVLGARRSISGQMETDSRWERLGSVNLTFIPFTTRVRLRDTL